ncbi:PAS domain-containing sensor histidine kinase [Alkaliflexus imshenetskii]|uniref:PAS domain-containing sensor histidine kinase n=1 Tax=Alkaliflexus imshenetskii TaxID=286730 RepID=UPI0004AF28B3|nr:ATP-binding protein [Alkaliflexus imshenetskii]
MINLYILTSFQQITSIELPVFKWALFVPYLLTDTISKESVVQIQQTVYIVLALLGIALAVFLYINFRNNLKRKKSASLETDTSNVPEKADAKENLSDFVILNSHPTPSAVMRTDGILTYVNPAFASIFGTSPENMHRLLLYNILPAHISTALSLSLSHNEQTSGITTNAFFSPNTKCRYKACWYRNGKNNSSQNILITLERISETPANDSKEKLIEESKILLRRVFDMAPVAVVVEDYGGTILEANDLACQMYGIRHEEMVGNAITGLSSSDFRKAIATSPQIISESEGTSFKSISYPRDASPVPVEIKVKKINYFGTQALVFLITNLTESIEKRKELDELKIKAQESDRLKSSFLSNLSHEVRTPMNSIMGFAELLAEPDIEVNERKEFIKLIRRSGKDLLTQINDMIDFSKLEAGLLNLNVDICDFELLLHQLHEYAQDKIGSTKEIKLFFELPAGIKRNGIATDVERLKQILTIFLSNSIKYTEKGVIEIGIKHKAPQLYEFYVRDTGIGIPEDKHRQIFEHFRQVDNSYSREFAGMGLGLSIASRLIQFMGGHPWIISEPGKGSEFRCVLPDLLFPQESTYLQVSCGPSTMIKKIMVVAPTEEIYLELSNNSKPINYQIFWAQNAQETKAMLLSNHIRYILIAVDLLPFWQELIPKIRGIQNKVQLIGLSNQLDPKRKERLLSMGLNDAVKTPITIPILLSILENNEMSAMNILTSTFNQN